MALGLFWDIVTGLPWTPNGVGSLEPRGYCIFLPGAHYLTINSPYGADSSLNKLLLLLLLNHCMHSVCSNRWHVPTALAHCVQGHMAKLIYCSSVWWGFTRVCDRKRLEAFLRRAIRAGYYDENDLTFSELCERNDKKLFLKVTANDEHILHQLLPEVCIMHASHFIAFI